MLLRRLSEHLRRHDWTAVMLDVAIVVIGVFLGIQVSNWNAARLDRAREAEIIEALISDLTEIETTTQRQIGNLAERVLDTKRIIEILRSDLRTAPDDDRLRQDFYNATTFLIAFTRSPTIVELISAGQTGLIRDRTLRSEIIRFDQVLQSSLSASARVIDILVMQIEYLLARVDPEYEFSADGREMTDYSFEFDLPKLRSDPLFIPALTEISVMHSEEIVWRRTIYDRAGALRRRLETLVAAQ